MKLDDKSTATTIVKVITEGVVALLLLLMMVKSIKSLYNKFYRKFAMMALLFATWVDIIYIKNGNM